MKRNKRTETMGHEDLTPLTEHILAQMGDEGVDIRERLKKLYRRRYLENSQIFQEHLDKTG
jgi:thermostable 8-oxoguanine DNA glycosylase